MKFVSKYSRMRPMFYYSKPINNLITNKQNKYEIIQTIEDKERKTPYKYHDEFSKTKK